MGHSHSISGALVWLAGAPLLAVTDPALLAAGAIVCAGAALLPDLDHPNSTIAHSFGPITQGIAGMTEVIAGGHRHATHSALFALAAGAGAFWAIHMWGATAGITLVAFFAGLAYKALGIADGRWLASAALALATAAAFYVWMPTQWSILPIAIAIGCLVHLVGDTLSGPIPWLWPLKQRLAIPLIPSTGGWVEVWLVAPAMLVGTAMLAWHYIGAPGLNMT